MNQDALIEIENARRAGFDLDLMEQLLAMTPEQRWLQHDVILNHLLELERVARERRTLARMRRRG